MRYIGGKSLLLNNIHSEINVLGDVNTITDIFSGSGVVSAFLAEKGYSILSNDLLYFSYVLSRGSIGIKKIPQFKKLKTANVLDFLNNLQLSDTPYTLDDCFVFRNYSPNDDCNRMYFQNDNAIKIDIIRLQIEDWKTEGLLSDDEYFYLLASLINAVPYVSNITGTYGAYLKFWDKRTYNPLILKAPDIISREGNVKCFNLDFTQMLGKKSDLLYADPPYNSREYLPNYHVLETIAKYDRPIIKGVTGIRDYSSQKSEFCKKNTVASAFEKLIKEANSKYILISYNNEGIMPTEELKELCLDYAVPNSFHLTEISYRRYKNKIPNNKAGLKEQLYFLRRK